MARGGEGQQHAAYAADYPGSSAEDDTSSDEDEGEDEDCAGRDLAVASDDESDDESDGVAEYKEADPPAPASGAEHSSLAFVLDAPMPAQMDYAGSSGEEDTTSDEDGGAVAAPAEAPKKKNAFAC